MIERDDNIPPLADLIAELDLGRRHAADAGTVDDRSTPAASLDGTTCIMPGPTLATLQRELQAHVLDPMHAMPAFITATPRVNRQRRVEIYTTGYRLRLIEALATDYPVLNALLGADDFAALATAYIDAYPSRHSSLRWFGGQMSEFLAHAAPYQEQPLLAQMACFEWTLGEAFDAADATSVSFDELARLPATAWHELHVVKHPSVREVSLGSLVPAYWRAVQDGESISTFASPGTPRIWRVWRHELRTLFRSMEILEVESARRLEAETFGDLCEYLSADMPMTEVPGFAAGLLRNWVMEGAIVRLAFSTAQVGLTAARNIA